MDAGDQSLIRHIKAGNLKAFEQVFKEHYALMCSVAMDYVSDSALCQTLTEDVLLNLWEKREGLEINTSLRAYLLRAVRNKCIDHLRANRQASDSVGYYDSMEGTFGYTFADERDLFEQLVSDELEALLEQAIDELPEERRRVFLMVRMENRTYRYLKEEPLFPFGFGLSYTTFAVSDPVFGEESVTAKVKNTGGCDGKAVVQVYAKSSGYPELNRQLVGFGKVFLKQGEEREVTISLCGEILDMLRQYGETELAIE